MKRLSDYTGNEAIDLWADLITPLSAILSDEGVKVAITSGKSQLIIAQEILKSHSKEAVDILMRIDDTPINGLNIILRVISLIEEIEENKDIASFFGFAEQTETQNVSFGLLTVSTEESEN